ncbi:Crp/Fnr family transcriptional regulator [Frigidibacter sp. MR17.24]|uniref:Crp/Fnr family transcriptional regulator n=1 Tax=Frigidibacter sp. MR17.24 TaxID=3127345 RepID=UPI003013044C
MGEHGGELGDEDWTLRFHGLSRLPEPLRLRLRSLVRIAELPAGTRIFGPGQAPTALLLLLQGAVRVSQVSDQGREILLYRVQAGESCVLTTACLLAYEDYTAEGVAETDIRAALLPREAFEELIATSPEFRRFVFAAYARRITDLFTVIEEVAFRRMDIRLAAHLLARADEGPEIRATHQALAAELGTAREVVSRTLQDFARRGWIAQGRGSLTVTDAAGLRGLAES